MSKSFIFFWFCVILFSSEYKTTIKIIYNLKANIAEEKISQEFRLKDVDDTRNYLIEEIEQWFIEQEV